MSDIATPMRDRPEAPFRLLPPLPLLLAAAVLGLIAARLPGGAGAFVLGGASAGLIALALIICCDRTCVGLTRRLGLFTARRLLQGDRRPSLVSDAGGRLLDANPAARHAPWLADAPTIARAFAARLADPEARLGKMIHTALAEGRAETRIDTGDGPLLLTCRPIRLGKLILWQAEVPQPGEDRDLWVDISGGRIVAASPAATALFGSAAPLDACLGAVPLHGRLADLPLSRGGMRRMLLLRQGGAEGEGRIHLLPAEAARDDLSGGEEARAFDTLPVPIVSLGPTGEVRLANRPARALLALPDGHDIPPLSSLVEGMGRPIGAWLADAARGHGLGKPEIVRAVTPKGEVFLQIVLGRALSGDGLVAVLNDATELKTLEAQFVQSQKMQAIGQLAGGVAHDFNNLLTAISGHCDLLLLSRSTRDSDYADLVQISQNANRAAALVGQLLAFSRKQAQRPELIDLRETLGDLTHLLNRLVGETIRLELRHDPNQKAIRADPRQLEQVFMNLVVNSRDAMSGGGLIRIETRTERLDQPLVRDRAEVPPGDYVVVTLTDNGRGIPPDKLPKIFEPFFTTKRQGEGTGLGLSTVYGIVKQSGGFIFAESEPGRGATFSLYFPAHELGSETAPAAPRKTAGAVPRGQGVVLLVEDEAPVRSFAARALRMRGWTVLEADCAEDALETLSDATLKVDVFVTDVIMPGRDGPSWVREALDTRADTRVVFVSGYAEENFPEVQASVPNSMFLPKPFTLEQLSRAVSGELVAAE